MMVFASMHVVLQRAVFRHSSLMATTLFGSWQSTPQSVSVNFLKFCFDVKWKQQETRKLVHVLFEFSTLVLSSHVQFVKSFFVDA